MQNGIMVVLPKGDIIMGSYNCCRIVKAERILNLIFMLLPSWSHLNLYLAMIMCARVQDPQEVPWRVCELSDVGSVGNIVILAIRCHLPRDGSPPFVIGYVTRAQCE